MSTGRIATLKRGRGGAGYRQKRCFLKLRKDAERKCLFFSNVSTLLSMIVGTKCRLQTEYKMQAEKKTFFYVRNVSTFDFITYLMVVSIGK